MTHRNDRCNRRTTAAATAINELTGACYDGSAPTIGGNGREATCTVVNCGTHFASGCNACPITDGKGLRVAHQGAASCQGECRWDPTKMPHGGDDGAGGAGAGAGATDVDGIGSGAGAAGASDAEGIGGAAGAAGAAGIGGVGDFRCVEIDPLNPAEAAERQRGFIESSANGDDSSSSSSSNGGDVGADRNGDDEDESGNGAAAGKQQTLEDRVKRLQLRARWLRATYITHDCPLQPGAVASVRRPIHITDAPGRWAAVLRVFDGDREEVACVAYRFNISAATLSAGARASSGGASSSRAARGRNTGTGTGGRGGGGGGVNGGGGGGGRGRSANGGGGGGGRGRSAGNAETRAMKKLERAERRRRKVEEKAAEKGGGENTKNGLDGDARATPTCNGVPDSGDCPAIDDLCGHPVSGPRLRKMCPLLCRSCSPNPNQDAVEKSDAEAVVALLT